LLPGCKKQQTTLEQTPVRQEPVQKVEPPPPVDTSDNVSFKEADLEAEFQRKVRENLQVIYFDFNSYKLRQSDMDKLGVAAGFLSANQNLRILIEGHCDERGSSEYNMGLGENRARVVKDYFVNYGIPSVRIEITSWGKEKPVMTGCADDECHAKNRRVEYKVLAH
jgi:peptidoglycan-associated lipoprotein